jgi:hypothetical protein
MASVHAQVFVRDNVLRVESRLPRRLTAEGLTLEIAAATQRQRLVRDLCSIRHAARWTLGSSSGFAVVDLLPAGTELTELIVQLDDERRLSRRVDARRRAVARRFVMALRHALVADGHDVAAVTNATTTDKPWRTPA